MSVKVEIYQVTLLCRCAALIVEVLERTTDADLNFVLLSSTVLLKNSFVFFFQIMEGAAGLSPPPTPLWILMIPVESRPWNRSGPYFCGTKVYFLRGGGCLTHYSLQDKMMLDFSFPLLPVV